MTFAWALLAISAAMLLLGLVYRSARRRREYLVLAFTERIGYPVSTSVIGLVDRRIRDRLFGFTLGGLAALLGFGMVIWIWPEFSLTGLAGFAVSGILMAAPATGGAVFALRQFSLSPESGTSRVARLDAPTLPDYVNPGWFWAAAGATVFGVALTAGLLTGALPPTPGNAGPPLAGVAALAAFSIIGLVGATLLSRRLLAIPQPASTELELQWDDALRAFALRDIWIASIGLSTATFVAACSWVLDTSSPSFYAAALIGSAPLIFLSLPASKRSCHRLWPHALITS